MASFRKFLALITITGIALALIVWTFVSFEFRSPIFAFLINWLVMSWVAMMGQFVMFPLLPETYYEIKPFEQSGQVYEQLGVSIFKKLVRRGPLTVFSPTLRFPAERSVSALKTLENEMRKAETSHLAIFFLILLLLGYALVRGWLDAVAWLLLFNIFFNGYPVMLQRYNRLKIEKLINGRMESQSQKEA
ncbi:MAG TPA: hypothetical protein VK206_01595 [Anaerolineales bacterium]|nr:hypothetical protein [Anaerolineales bacterium]HLO29816.1 hypothetical protein [Anaerolineales bacterium]